MDEIKSLFKNRRDPESSVKSILFIVGILLTPITLAGSLWFYVRSYYRNEPTMKRPTFENMRPVTKLAMVIGGILIWIIIYAVLGIIRNLLQTISSSNNYSTTVLIGYLTWNLLFLVIVWGAFYRWRKLRIRVADEENRYGGARLATHAEYDDLNYIEKGIYIGNINLKYDKTGHGFICAGAGSGKGTNFIIYNLLGAGNYDGSIFVTDPKGENYAVCARHLRNMGYNVIALDAWHLMTKDSQTYNPLDLINPKDPDSLVDDSALIASMIVPDNPEAKEPFWDSRSRSWITGFIIHLMTCNELEKTLTKIWEWTRLGEKDFGELLIDMITSENKSVRATGNEIKNLIGGSDTFTSLMANVHDATDFLKSPSLQASLKSSNFNINSITNGKTAVFLIIPADKIETQARYLRTVISTALMASVRNVDKRITFYLDEFNYLGKMKIIEQYMALSRGYGVCLIPIVQNLTQLAANYGQNWETFIANSAFRLYFGINDNFTADYLSKSIGQSTFFTHIKTETGQGDATARPVLTPDEVKSLSAKHILLQVEQRPTYVFKKVPYYIDKDMIPRADQNPYSDALPLDDDLFQMMKPFEKLPKKS